MLAERYDAFLLDLDGVLYRGDLPVPHAGKAVAQLRRADRAVAFVTNNSARTPSQVVEKLATVGVSATTEEVVTSALATGATLAERGGGTAFVVGEDGLRRALTEAGIRVVDGEVDRADFVVVGWDRSADYEKLRTASVLVQRGARLVATNPDGSYPAPDGLRWPGAGALLAVLTATTGADPEVVGKPYPPLFRVALERVGGTRPLVVGDRLDTDIAGAEALGWDSLLVLTGISRSEDLSAAGPRPTFVAQDLRGLFVEPEPRTPAP